VTFNGTAATTINTWTITSITVIVPTGATTGNVVVTVAGSASNGVPFTVLQVPTVALSSSANPSIYGSSVTFTATVNGNVGSPTGTVSFSDGTTVLGSSSISSGTASLTTSALAGGTHSITASYGGNSSYTTAQSTALSQLVNPATMSLALSDSATATINFGDSVTFTVAVTPASATGNVTFSDGSTILGSAAITNGQAVYTTSSLDAGTHSITASFAADGNFLATTSTVLTATVSAIGVTVNVCYVLGGACVQAGGTSTYGDNATFNITVVPDKVSPGQPVPVGKVSIHDGAPANPATAFDSADNKAGGVSFSTSALTGGQHDIGGNFDGDGVHYFGQVSTTPAVWIVNPAASATNLVSSANPSATSSSVTFTATVAGLPGRATPTGNVDFNDNFNNANTKIGSGTLDASGKTTFSTPNLQAGTHTITAVYNAAGTDHNYAGSTSAPLQQVVVIKPKITLFFPSHTAPPPITNGGPAGMSFDIVGVNFGATQGTVTFNNNAIAAGDILLWSDQKITTRVPANAQPGNAPVIVTTSDGKVSDPVNFTVRAKFLP
jgi:hypothetical protein